MKSSSKVVLVLMLAYAVTGSVWASQPFHKKNNNYKPKLHHNAHKPGKASNSQLDPHTHASASKGQ